MHESLGAIPAADFSVYDPSDDAWSVLPDLPRATDHAGAGAIAGAVYVAGGRETDIERHVPSLYGFTTDRGQ